MRESNGHSPKKSKKKNMLQPSGNKKKNQINSMNLITNLSSSNSSNISIISGNSSQQKNLIDNNSIFLNDFVNVGEDDPLNESTIGVTSKKRNLKQEKEADAQKRAVAADLGGGSWFSKLMKWNKPRIPRANVAGLDKIRYGYVNTDYFDFEKNRAYRNDKELQSFRALLDTYNHQGGTAEQEIKLMEAAAEYIGKHSTGKTAKHKGRTEMMEDVLYQLTMQGGTKEKADKSVENAKTKVILDPERPEEHNKVQQNLNNLKDVYHNDRFSKSLQMIAADVMSRAGSVSKIVPKPGGGFRDKDTGYEIDSRTNMGSDENLVSTFHEFTHLADADAFENAMAAAISPDASDDEVRNLAFENSGKAARLYALTKDIGPYDYQTGGLKYSAYVEGSQMKNERLEQQGGGPRGQEYLRKQKKGTEAIQRVFPKGLLRTGIGTQVGFQALNEYDAVTNELFLQYELGHPGEDKKKSQVYRLLKSMAIDSHVRRRIADLKKRMKQKG